MSCVRRAPCMPIMQKVITLGSFIREIAIYQTIHDISINEPEIPSKIMEICGINIRFKKWENGPCALTLEDYKQYSKLLKSEKNIPSKYYTQENKRTICYTCVRILPIRYKCKICGYIFGPNCYSGSISCRKCYMLESPKYCVKCNDRLLLLCGCCGELACIKCSPSIVYGDVRFMFFICNDCTINMKSYIRHMPPDLPVYMIESEFKSNLFGVMKYRTNIFMTVYICLKRLFNKNNVFDDCFIKKYITSVLHLLHMFNFIEPTSWRNRILDSLHSY